MSVDEASREESVRQLTAKDIPDALQSDLNFCESTMTGEKCFWACDMLRKRHRLVIPFSGRANAVGDCFPRPIDSIQATSFNNY
jgi:hypothetical protein